MKNVKYLLIALLISPIFMVNTGCGGDDVPPTTTDTTDNTNKDTATAGFTTSFKRYELVIDPSFSGVYYDETNNVTTVEYTGYTTKGELGADITDKAVIDITFTGKATGLITEMTSGFEMRITTGEGVKEVEWRVDNTTPMSLTIEEYGEVGELVKASFDGTLKSSLSSKVFSKGYFSVPRKK